MRTPNYTPSNPTSTKTPNSSERQADNTPMEFPDPPIQPDRSDPRATPNTPDQNSTKPGMTPEQGKKSGANCGTTCPVEED